MKSVSKQISVASVSERDIDLLLLEEFLSTPSFGDWLVSETVGLPLGRCICAQRSVTQSTGESDLELLFDGASPGTLLLIENKVGANLQPRQAERYQLRGAAYLDQGKCSAFHTLMIAPERYFGKSDSTKGFDFRLTYEAIQNWFRTAENIGHRRFYKMALLQAAIDKSTLGYQPNEDGPTTQFWADYWALSQTHAPELEMAKPGLKTAGSTFVSLRPPSLSSGIEIVHKLTGVGGSRCGFIDLQISGLGGRTNELRSALKPSLDEDMEVVKTSKSAAIRLKVELVDPNVSSADQKPIIIAGLLAAVRLWSWYSGEVQKTIEEVSVREQTN